MEVQEETLEWPRMQKLHKGPRPKTAATRQHENREPSSRLPLCLRKERRTTNSIEGWSSRQGSPLGSRETVNKIQYEIFRGKIAKQVVGTSSGI
jgi:hypothetical protein